MRINTPLHLAVSLLTLPAVACAAAAQQPSQSPQPTADHSATTLRVHANEVLLPVTVIDKHGALVTTLKASDFTLTEDGRAQVIKSFTTESNLPFKLGLLVDTSRSMSGAMDNERKAAGKFVDQMLPDDAKAGTRGDQAFLIHFDREVELLEDFTNARDKLHREIDDMGPSAREHNDQQGPETRGDDRDSSQRGGRQGGTQLYDAIYLAADELMKGQSGRKALVVFSDGGDRGSKETLNDAIDAADRAGLQIFTVYFKGEADRSGFSFPGRQGGMGGGGYPGSGGGWPGGGGSGYPGGGGGRRGGNEPQIDGRKIMQQIASRTGGQFFEAKKKENLEDIYGLIAGALRQQYLLAYAPDKQDTDGEFHHIALKVNNGDYTVITREGYFGPGGDK